MKKLSYMKRNNYQFDGFGIMLLLFSVLLVIPFVVIICNLLWYGWEESLLKGNLFEPK